ncbi:hypothetical protein [Clostridium thermobutyricum]|uniref:hypothetical protein n=1 Tax=Clostridium thermobutyricum TaxID=29372 RepID=UPI0018ABDCAA|nr:hypothetical protein [Clostridium thermobutyricum]
MTENLNENSTENIVLELNSADDNGNGTRKVYISKKIKGAIKEETYIEAPNVMSRKPSHNNTDTWTNAKLLELSDNLMISFPVDNSENNEYFYIGKYALEGGGSLESTNISSPTAKLESDITICGLGYIAAEAIKFAVKDIMEKEQKSLDEISIDEIGEIIVNSKYITALPVRVFNKENKIKLINKLNDYEGRTVRVVVNDNKFKDVKINFNKKIGAVPEAVDITHFLINPTEDFLNALNKENGTNITKEYFLKETRKIMHLSIGEGTTEYPVTYNRVYWDEKFQKGTDNGVGVALEVALSKLRTDGFNMFNSRQSVMESYLDEDDRFHDVVKATFEAPLKTQVYEIIKTLTEELSKAKKADTLIVYGGGSIAMKEILKPQLIEICKKLYIKLLYVPAEYAVKLEALGLREIVNK